MSQAWHAEKMLRDAPSPPAVRVEGMIYYTDELLELCDKKLFIPERFFYEVPTCSGTQPSESQPIGNLFALGHIVTRSEV